MQRRCERATGRREGRSGSAVFLPLVLREPAWQVAVLQQRQQQRQGESPSTLIAQSNDNALGVVLL